MLVESFMLFVCSTSFAAAATIQIDDEDILSSTVSDDALEAVAGHGQGALHISLPLWVRRVGFALPGNRPLNPRKRPEKRTWRA